MDDKAYKDATEAIQATASNHGITLVESESCDLVDSVLKVVESAKGDGWCYDMSLAPRDGSTIIVDGGTVHWRELMGWFSHSSQRPLQWEPKAWQPLPKPPKSEA